MGNKKSKWYLLGSIASFGVAFFGLIELFSDYWGHSILYFIVQIFGGILVGIRLLLYYKKLKRGELPPSSAEPSNPPKAN